MSTIEEQLKALREETLASLKQIYAENEKELQELRVSVLGKKGSLTEILKGMKMYQQKCALLSENTSMKLVMF